MTRGAAPDEAARRGTRRLLAALLAGYLVFVVYGSLVPLNYVPLPWDEAWRRFAHLPYYQLGIGSRADWVANGLLMIPLTYLAASLLPERLAPATRVLAAMALWGLAGALAVAIEFTQLFFPGRTVGLNDILAESVGAAAGLLLQAASGRRALDWLQGWWQREQQSDRLQRALHLYLLGLLFYAVMPLDLTISPVELLHKMNSGPGITLLPFSDWPREAAPLAYKGVTDLLLWLPAGLLWRLAGVPARRAVVRGLGGAALVELLQLFVYSRHSSVTDIVTGGLGTAAGVGLAAWLAPRLGKRPAGTAGSPSAALAPGGGAGLGWIAWGAWLVLVLAVFWYPYDFRSDGSFLRPRLEALDRPLLTAYYMGSEFHALTELLRKVLMFLPGGFAWAWAQRHAGADGRAWRRGLGFAMPLLVAATVEGGQLLLPDKVADLSDLLFESAGAWIGMGLCGWLVGAAPPAQAVGRHDQGRTQSGPLRREDVALRYASALAPWRLTARAAWAATLKTDLVTVALLAAGLVLAGRLEGMPYNVRELFDGGEGLVAAGVVALTLWSLWTLPLVLLEAWAVRPEAALWLVPGLPLAAALPAVLMVVGVPAESLGDIVGSPVLGWPRGIEDLLRYAALHGALLLAATGAAWAVVRLAAPLRFELLPRWLVAVLLWAGPLHLVVVHWAATDNLTELMRDGGSLAASVLLFCGLLAVFMAAFALAAAVTGAGRAARRTARLLVVAGLAWTLGTLLLWSGSEHALTKYGHTFSAAQFLLSTDRSHYAGSGVLWWRFGLASLGLAAAATVLQAARWRRLAGLLSASITDAAPDDPAARRPARLRSATASGH